MTQAPEERMQDALIEQASRWQARHLSGELSAAEKSEFLQWLRRSPENVREYLRGAQLARLMPSALAGLDDARAVTNVVVLDAPASDRQRKFAAKRIDRWMSIASSRAARGSHASRWLPIAAAVLLSCGIIWAGVQQYVEHAGRTMSVPRGDQRTLRLDDGSIVHLNSQSRARIRYSTTERLHRARTGPGDVQRRARCAPAFSRSGRQHGHCRGGHAVRRVSSRLG